MRTSSVLRYHAHGKPDEVLQYETLELPEPGPDEVLLEVEASVIHPSDFGMILGSYGKLRPLPAVAGREGVARIRALGSGVTGWSVGDRVRIPEQAGAWRSALVVPASGLWSVPADLPVEMAAMLWVNPPTAWRVLRDAHLQPGQWVVQNAANSAVGLFLVQMARSLGIRTLNVVRRQEYVRPIEERGGDVVVLEDSGYEREVSKLTGGGEVRLGLNSVGGESALRLIRSLSPGGRLVTIGAMSFEPIRFPTRQLIFDDISLTGFWMDRWYREQSRDRIAIMMDRIFAMARDGIITAPIASTHPLAEWKSAVKAAAVSRLGKVLFSPKPA